MNNQFKRSTVLPILMIIPSGLIMFSAFVQLNLGYMIGIAMGLVGIAYLVNAIWQLSTPLIRVEKNIIYHKKAIWNQEEIELKYIVKMDLSSEIRVDLFFESGHRERIRLGTMVADDREKFKALLKEQGKELVVGSY